MPAALPVDWTAIQVLAAKGHTLEELATMTGVSVNTLKARSAREGWKDTSITEEKQAKAVAVAVAKGQMQPSATNGLEMVQNTLLANKQKSKLAQSGYLAKASQALEQVPDDHLLAHAETGLRLASMYAKLHPEDQQDASVHLSFFSISQAQAEQSQVIDVQTDRLAGE